MTMRDAHTDGPSATAYKRLRYDLLNNAFKPGEQLLISGLAARYRVSSTPVREALNRLREEMLIDFRPGRGYFCRMPEHKELEDLLELLCLLLIFSADSILKRKDCVRTVADAARRIVRHAASGGTSPGDGGETAALVEGAIAGVIAVGGNEAALEAGRNALVRTHFVRRLDLECPDAVRHVSATLIDFETAVRRNDKIAAEQAIRRETARSIERLPHLLREGLWRFHAAPVAAEGRSVRGA